MANIEDLKITSANTNGKKVADLSDNPSESGMSAQQLKEHFDALPEEIIKALNALIDYLAASGASGIGVSDGVSVVTLQSLLDTLTRFESNNIKHIRINNYGRLEASADNKIWFAVGTGEAGTAREIGAVACNIPMTLIVNDKKGLTLMYEE